MLRASFLNTFCETQNYYYRSQIWFTQDVESPLRKLDSICKTENLLDEDARSIGLCCIHSLQIFHQIEEWWESISPSSIYNQRDVTHIYGSMKLVRKQRTRETCDSFEAANHSGMTYIYMKKQFNSNVSSNVVLIGNANLSIDTFGQFQFVLWLNPIRSILKRYLIEYK